MKKATNLIELLRVTQTTPLKDETYDAFFVETDLARGENTAAKLSDYFTVNSDTPQKVLFMGHRGSGKSTELYRVEKYLGDDFKVVNFSILEEADATDLQYIDILFIILSKLYETAEQDEIDIDENVLKNLESYWNDEKFKEEIRISEAEISGAAELKAGLWGVFSSSIKGIFKTSTKSKETVRKYIEPKVSRLLQDTNDLISDISGKYRKQNKTLLLIIEDLDKLDIEIAENIFLNHSKVLTSFNLHIIYTFPIFLHYSEKFNTITDSFDRAELLSMIKINNKDHSPYEEGRSIIKKIIEQRLDLKLIDDDALKLIIEKSGGAIRQILKMIQDATLEERSKDREAVSVSKNSAQRAYVAVRSDFERCIEQKHLKPLIELYESKDSKPLQDENLKEMLSCLAVIEYNGDRWCGLHPAVEDYLMGKELISDVSR